MIASASFSSLLVLAGLALFALGFFLTRTELKDQGECLYDEGPLCSFKAKYDRVVIVVIDALRVDFVMPETLSKLHDSADKPSFYLNKIKAIKRRLQSQPQHSFVSRLDADPPTTTMQRLKGIATGGLPTFIDIKDDVASEQISEDNLLLQLHNRKRNVTFMGDDTWVKLFPELITKQFPYESFNVKDLDTLDNGVNEHLHPELAKNDWNVLIAHYLGVDHAGHRYGPRHSEMTRKLLQMDQVLENLMNELDKNHPDTLLLVLGDHGMTEDGNHGGASSEERSAAFFAYSPRKKLCSNLDIPEGEDGLRTVQQIDLAPTLALLLDVPIPFGNLGFFVSELVCDDDSGTSHLSNMARANTKQILRYLQSYSQRVHNGGVDQQTLNRLNAELTKLDSEENKKDALIGYKQVAREAADLARALWTQFDYPMMLSGIALVGLGTALLIVQTFGYTHSSGELKSRNAMFNMHENVPYGLVISWIFSLLALVSNSFIVAENWVSVFCLVTATALDAKRSVSRSFWNFLVQQMAILALARASVPFGLWMRNIAHEIPAGAMAWPIYSIIPLGYIGRLVLNDQQRLTMSVVYKVGIILQMILASVFWFLSFMKLPHNWFAWGVYALTPILGACSRTTYQLLCSGIVTLALILGPAGPSALLGFFSLTTIVMVTRYDSYSHPWRGAAIAQLVVLWFFATGHSCDFGTLRITAPYVGFEEFGYWRGVVMLTLDTFAPHLLGVAICFALGRSAILGFLSVMASRAFVTTCFVFYTRRHLMLWAIFAPKFVFDASSFGAALLFAGVMASADYTRTLSHFRE